MKNLRLAIFSFDQSAKKTNLIDFANLLKPIFLQVNFIYSEEIYPLIQIKKIGDKLAILAIEQMAIKLLKPLTIDKFKAILNNKTISITSTLIKDYNISFLKSPKKYIIYNFYPFKINQLELYSQLKKSQNLKEQLQTLLKNHILAFLNAINFGYQQDKLKINILNIGFQKQGTLNFDLTFESNINIPNYIGIGHYAFLSMGITKTLSNSD